MPKLKAIREIRYAGFTYFPGDEFDASDKDARVLNAIKKTELAPPRKAEPKPVVEKKEEPKPGPKSEPGRYHRRDMVADGRLGEGIVYPSSSRADPAPEPASKKSDEKPKRGRPSGSRSKKT